jgi:hypothetical protein
MVRVRSLSPALVLTVSMLVLVSCGGTDPYPKDWSSVAAVERGDCSAYTGTFYNYHSKSSPDAPTLKGGLMALLVGLPPPDDTEVAKSVTRVSIERPSAERLKLTGFNGTKLVWQGGRSLPDGSCSKKGLPLSGKLRGSNEENILGVVAVSGRLQSAENGDLIARMRTTFTGIALLVPVSIHNTSWYRFKRIDPEPMSIDPVQ